ncbi:hypothetical protein STXM2123_946 [Streptomyces sp. F-3]|nr:hypothetical protein STXM2123_946 [Streptomyces sp. F-3]
MRPGAFRARHARPGTGTPDERPSPCFLVFLVRLVRLAFLCAVVPIAT